MLRGSVGKGARNQLDDVRIVQGLLNHHFPAGKPLLKVDGIVGPKTLAAIRDYQSRVLRVKVPDERVDPGGATLKSLTAGRTLVPQPVAVPTPLRGPSAAPLPRSFVANEAALRDELAKENALWWSEFRQTVEDTTTGWSLLFTVYDRADDVRKIAHFWKVFRMAGDTRGEAAKVIAGFYGLAKEDPVFAKNVMEFLGKSKGTFAPFWNWFSKAGKAVVFVSFVISYHGHWLRGDYHMAFVDIYKTWMGEAVPWAGILDAVESFATGVGGEKLKKNSQLFKYIRTTNLIGLGANTVDALGVVIHSAVTREIDLARFKRLEDRVRNSPAQVFVEIGDDLADALVKIVDMSDQEFNEMMTATNVGNWLRYVATGRMPGE